MAISLNSLAFKSFCLILSFDCLLRGTLTHGLTAILFIDLLVYQLSPLLECQHHDARKRLSLLNIVPLTQCLAHSRRTTAISWKFLLNALHYQPTSQ